MKYGTSRVVGVLVICMVMMACLPMMAFASEGDSVFAGGVR